jgi:hypothetical protein
MAIDPKIFELIRASDPEERKKGIKALARTEDREALRYLASLHSQDPEPEVRELALKAGQHIKKRGELSHWGEDSGKAVAKLEAVDIKKDGPKGTAKLPNDAKTKEAKKLMDSAMDMVMRSEYAQAQDLAYQAFGIAPNLGSDPYYASLAGEIMGLPEGEALVALREGRPDVDMGGKSKRKRGAGQDSTPTWGDFFVDAAILFVASAGAFVFFMAMLFNQIQGMAASGIFTNMGSYSEYGSFDPTSQVMNFLAGSGLTLALIVGLIGGLFVVLTNFLHFGLLHLCAGFLGGGGSFRNLVHKAIIPLVIQSLASVVIMGITYYFTFQAIIDAGGNTNALMISNDTSGLLSMLNALSYLIGFGYTLWLSYIVGQNYDFGFGKGCGTLIISYIVVFAVTFCGTFALISALAR